MFRALLFLMGCALCAVCLACAASLMVLDKPWWTWTLFILLGLGFIPRARLS
jgi:4-amino-4-deoxy-L-arabinose transferase-like glycosyltransferase